MDKNFLSFRASTCTKWDDLAEWTKCTKCSYSKKRKKVVLGYGNRNADIMFVSDYPGSAENSSGIPFSGKAGDYLKGLVKALFKQEFFDMFYATNILACKPPSGTNTNKAKIGNIRACLPRLLCEIYLVDPMLIIAAGSVAVSTLTGKSYSTEAFVGNIIRVEFPGRQVPYVKPVMIWPNPIQLWRHNSYLDDSVPHMAAYALYEAYNLVAETKYLMYDYPRDELNLTFDKPATWRIYARDAKDSQSDNQKSEERS